MDFSDQTIRITHGIPELVYLPEDAMNPSMEAFDSIPAVETAAKYPSASIVNVEI